MILNDVNLFGGGTSNESKNITLNGGSLGSWVDEERS